MSIEQKVVAIYIAKEKGLPMESVGVAEAIAGSGLKGDRYCTGEGSYNKGKVGNRQVTLINSIFFENSEFNFVDSRRNIITSGVELMWLIGKRFSIGDALFEGERYCDPCQRPSNLSGNKKNFKEVFFNRSGLIAKVVNRGIFRVNDEIVTPKKNY